MIILNMNIILLLFALILISVDSYKILVYQTLPGSSHIAFSGKLVDTLVEAGHTVDKFIVEWNPFVLSNGTTKARRIRRFQLSKESPWLSMPHLAKPFEDKFYTWGDDEPVFYRKTLEAFCDEMLLDTSVLEWIKEGEYDAAMSSAYDACGIGLFHLAGIKPVFIYSATTIIDHWAMILGLPNMASYIPSKFLSSLTWILDYGATSLISLQKRIALSSNFLLDCGHVFD